MSAAVAAPMAVSEPGARAPAPRHPRVGLVLGAGGPVGHAWHAGVLSALETATGWDPREAALVVGTSAGAQVGALLRAGMHGADLVARVTGSDMTPTGSAIARHFVRPAHEQPEGARSRRPASGRFLRHALVRPWLARPGRLAAALLPEGGVDLAPQITAMRRLFDRGWSRDPLWITAAQLDTGAPVVFGHPDYPETDVGTAMASSGAVPGVCAPVRVGEHRYVDGGMISATHLDPVADAAEDLDLVIVSSPLSMYTPMRGLLHAEIRRLRRRVPVVAVEPHGPARREMGWNPMDLARAPEVARSTVDTLLESMRGGRHRPLADLLQKEDSPWIDAPQ